MEVVTGLDMGPVTTSLGEVPIAPTAVLMSSFEVAQLSRVAAERRCLALLILAHPEGGVVVSLPEARQIFTSGNSDHKERWIKEPGTRDTAHLPDHMRGKGAFFLQSGSLNQYTAGADGDIVIYPWDHIFTDNFGFYRLHILLKRGSGELPVVD